MGRSELEPTVSRVQVHGYELWVEVDQSKISGHIRIAPPLHQIFPKVLDSINPSPAYFDVQQGLFDATGVRFGYRKLDTGEEVTEGIVNFQSNCNMSAGLSQMLPAVAAALAPYDLVHSGDVNSQLPTAA